MVAEPPFEEALVGIGDVIQRRPVHDDDRRVHATLVRIGKTSITVHLDAWVLRRNETSSILVTDGNFTYVSIDDRGQPQPIKRDGATIGA